MKSFVLFNNKGGVGKTTLTFNIAHLLSRNGRRVVVLDCDPQSNITAIFLDESALAELWDNPTPAPTTVAGCVDLVQGGKGELLEPHLRPMRENLWLLPGSLTLSRFEQTVAEEWGKVQTNNNERPVDVTCALARLAERAGKLMDADYVLVDVGPSLGALNRAVLLGCDAVVIPVAPDLFSLQGLRNIGPTLREWREDWDAARQTIARKTPGRVLPHHEFQPLGYIVQQHLARSDRPVTGYATWADRIPSEFRESVLDEAPSFERIPFDQDEYCIAILKHFASLVPIAQLARKPMFELKQADGIGGGQIQAVRRCREEFERLVAEIERRLAAIDSPTQPATA